MLLKCHSCNARYEAPDDAFPPEGRVVECSACGARWLQPGPDRSAEAKGEAKRDRPEIPGLSEAAEALAALRAPESPKRRPDADAAPADEPPADDADGGDAPARPIVTRVGVGAEPAADEAADDEPEAPKAPEAPKPAREARGRERLPDAARLNADLRASGLVEEPERRGGFWLGLILAFVVSGALAGAYVARDRIAEAVPEAAPALESYARVVDDARVATESAIGSATETASGLIDRAGDAIDGALELKVSPEETDPDAPAEDGSGARSDG